MGGRNTKETWKVQSWKGQIERIGLIWRWNGEDAKVTFPIDPKIKQICRFASPEIQRFIDEKEAVFDLGNSKKIIFHVKMNQFYLYTLHEFNSCRGYPAELIIQRG